MFLLVDRGANGGLAGSGVRILSRSSRNAVTRIDSHELQCLDVVQCAVLVETIHGIVSLIMNNLFAMVEDTPSIPLDRLSGSKTQLMIDLSKLVVNGGPTPLMAMLCPWFADVVSCTLSPWEALRLGFREVPSCARNRTP